MIAAKKHIVLILFIITPFWGISQVKSVEQAAHFFTFNQPMWETNDDPGINTVIELLGDAGFNEPFNLPLSFGLLGGRFGVDLAGHIGFGIGPLEFRIEGFTTGQVDVEYPTTIALEMPGDDSFNRGDIITIRSSFSAEDGARIETRYPAAGTIGLYLGYRISASLTANACLYFCTGVLPIIPSFTVDDELVIFEIGPFGGKYLCPDETALFQCDFGFEPPWVIAPENSPLSGTFNIPHVETTSQIYNTTDLRAYGEDNYVTLSLDIMDVLTRIVPQLKILNSKKTFGAITDVTGEERGITLHWEIIALTLDMPFTHKQDFRFTPTIVTELTFPDTVEYSVFRRSGAVVPGKGINMVFESGDEVKMKFPCHYDFMDVYAKHWIKDEGNFSNKTYDNISVQLDFAFFDFLIEIDPYYIIPAIHIPWPIDADIGPFGFPGLEIDPPPLIDPDPLVLLSQDFPPYFDRKWSLQGFEVFEIEEPFRLNPRKREVELLVENIACHGDSTGTASITIANGTEPITYEWSFHQTGDSPTDIYAGKHYVKITDGNGCVSFEHIEVKEPSEVTIDLSIDSIRCFGDQGRIVASAQGGTGLLDYLWSTGDADQTIDNLNAGAYVLTVTDENDCETTREIELEEPTKLTGIIAQAIHPSCAAKNDGSLALYVEGGTVPYRYEWSNFSALRDQENLTAGTYSITVTDANDCISTDEVTLADPPTLNANLFTVANIACFGEHTGRMRVDASGGTPPYTYRWYDSLITYNTSGPQINQLEEGSYSVEVMDDNGCSIVRKGRVRQPAQPLQADILATQSPCHQQLAGILDLTVQGGTPPYRYIWSNGSTNEDLYSQGAGEYRVTVLDNNDCETENKALLIDPDPLRINLIRENVSCSDAQDGMVSVENIVGGIPPFELLWSTGDTGYTIEGLPAGIYSVMVTDATGCLLEEEKVVSKNSGECLFIPNTFTPNGDQYNDEWNIQNIHLYPEVEVAVYNKWGNVVFQSRGYESAWDGTHHGKVLEPTTYYYFVNLNNGYSTYSGFVEIIR